MVKDVYYGKTRKKSFARQEEILEISNLLESKKKDYQRLLDIGLREVFRDRGPITDYTGKIVLPIIDYSLNEEPEYSFEQKQNGSLLIPRAGKDESQFGNGV